MELIKLLFLIIVSTVFALLEIQIEGKNGWAKDLPTWKLKNPFRKFINWEYLTGYHFYLWLLLILLFHLPFTVGLTFTLKNEFILMQMLFLIFILEDFLWFVLNPAWGLNKFFKKEIPWHSGKFLFLPKNYWTTLVVLVIFEIALRYL